MAAVAVITMLLSSCGGVATDAMQEDTTQEVSELSVEVPEPQETAQAPVDVPEFGTVEQYASVVAESKSKIEEQIAAIEECSLGSWDEGSLVCPFAALGMVPIAGILKGRLAGEDDLREDLRLDPPPPEIEKLVARTVQATQAAMDAAETASDCGDADECELEWFELSSAARSLQGVVDAWGPYL